MHHNPAKNVLHRKFTLDEVAAQTGRSAGGSALAAIDSAHRKLLAARAEAAHAVYRSHALHGLECDGGDCVSRGCACAACGGAARFALLTLDRIIAEAWDGEDALQHVIAYGGGRLSRDRRKSPGHARRLRDDRSRLYRWLDCKRARCATTRQREARRCHDCEVLRPHGRSVFRYRRSVRMERSPGRAYRADASLCRIRRRRPAIQRRLRPCCALKN